MSGLLRKIQKPRARLNDRVSDVVVDPSQAKKRDELVSGDFRFIKSSRIERGAEGEEAGSSRGWEESGESFSKKISLLAQDMIRVANDLVVEERDQVIDWNAVFNTSVERARRTSASNVSYARYDISIVKRYFFDLVDKFGPLNVLIRDRTVTEIYVDDYNSVSVRKNSKLEKTAVVFKSPVEYKLFLKLLRHRAPSDPEEVSGRSLFLIGDEQKLLCSIVSDGPNSENLPRLCLRVPRPIQVTFYNLLTDKFLPAGLASWLTEVSSTAAENVLIVGPKDSMRSALAGSLLNAVSSNERILTVEELPEVLIANPQMEKLIFNNGYTVKEANDTLRFAVQRAPHRMYLDELRGAEAGTFLSLVEQGFNGAVTTIDSNTGKDGLWKFVDFVMRGDFASEESIVRRISRTFSIVLKIGVEAGSPVLLEVLEILPSDSGQFRMTSLVKFKGRANGERQWSVQGQETPLLRKLKAKFKIDLLSGDNG